MMLLHCDVLHSKPDFIFLPCVHAGAHTLQIQTHTATCFLRLLLLYMMLLCCDVLHSKPDFIFLPCMHAGAHTLQTTHTATCFLRLLLLYIYMMLLHSDVLHSKLDFNFSTMRACRCSSPTNTSGSLWSCLYFNR